MNYEPDIKIVAGLKGGGSLSGSSGKLIQDQLNTIASQISAKGGLKIAVGLQGGNGQSSEIFKQINAQIKSAQNLAKPINLSIKSDMNDFKGISAELNEIAKEMSKIQGFDIGKISVTSKNGAFSSASIQYYKDGIQQAVTDTIKLSDATKQIPYKHYTILRNTVEDYRKSLTDTLKEQKQVSDEIYKQQNAAYARSEGFDEKSRVATYAKLERDAIKSQQEERNLAHKEYLQYLADEELAEKESQKVAQQAAAAKIKSIKAIVSQIEGVSTSLSKSGLLVGGFQNEIRSLRSETDNLSGLSKADFTASLSQMQKRLQDIIALRDEILARQKKELSQNEVFNQLLKERQKLERELVNVSGDSRKSNQEADIRSKISRKDEEISKARGEINLNEQALLLLLKQEKAFREDIANLQSSNVAKSRDSAQNEILSGMLKAREQHNSNEAKRRQDRLKEEENNAAESNRAILLDYRNTQEAIETAKAESAKRQRDIQKQTFVDYSNQLKEIRALKEQSVTSQYQGNALTSEYQSSEAAKRTLDIEQKIAEQAKIGNLTIGQRNDLYAQIAKTEKRAQDLMFSYELRAEDSSKAQASLDILKEKARVEANITNGIDDLIAKRKEEAMWQSKLLQSQMQSAVEEDKNQKAQEEMIQQREQALASLNLLQSQFPKMAGTQFQTQFDAISQGLKDNTMSGEEANAQLILLRKNMTAAGLAGQTFGQKFKAAFGKFAQYVSVSTIIFSAIRSVKQMVSEVKELDSAMTQLQIVSGKSTSEIRKFGDEAIQVAKKIGVSATDILKASETYARLGYSLKDAMNLSEYTNIFANIASIDASSATDAITSVMKAYQLDAGDAEHITDILTKVGQEYAVSASELGIALQNGGASLQAANNSLEKSVALIAAGNAAVQDASKVGNALKTTSMRIRGATTAELEDAGADVDGMAESVSKLRDELLALSGVDIQIDENTFKDTYTIILELSKVWDKMSDISKANVLELLAGKRNATVIQSIISNIDDLEGAYASASNAMGTTAEANDIYVNSIEGKQKRLKTSFTEFSDSVVNSDLIKGTFDAGSGILGFLTKLNEAIGVLPTTLGIAGLGMLLKNLGSEQNDALHIGLSTYKYAA